MSDSESEEESIYTNPKLFFDSLPASMRPKEIFSPEEASKRADTIRRHLFTSWSRLKAIVLAHEATIGKRWKKRTAAKRKQLLSGVQPTLPEEHAPEVSAFMQNSGQRAGLPDKRDIFLFPYLNLDDLSINNGTQFLGLLHARAHRFPSEFALFDEDMIHFGVVSGGIQRYHGFNCAMVICGNEATYGRVLEYGEPLDKSEDSPEGGAMEHLLRESMSFGNGLVVLETQDKLMGFLLAVVSKILSDLDLDTLTPSPPIPAPVIPILNTTFQWQSSARANAMRPYGPPPAFSIDQIADIIDSQHDLAVQHLSDLRTDPNYLAKTLQSYYDHRIETFLNEALPSVIQNRATTLMLVDAYAFFAYYHIAKAVIVDFRCIVEKRFPNGIARARELPQEYENALIKLHPLFEILEHRVAQVHHQTICASPALRNSCSVRSHDPYFAKHELAFNIRPGDTLSMYLTVLLQSDQTHLWQLTRLFDGIDRITQDPVEHSRVSPLLANLLSQWGAINDCKAILEVHRPAVQSEGMESGMSRLKKWHPLIGPINEVTGPGNEFNLADKAFPLKQFVYPKGPCDAAWARRCQHVDDAFAAFWKATDRLMLKRCGKELFDLGTAVTASFAVERTDWAAVVELKATADRPKPSAAALLPFGGAAQTPLGARDEDPGVKVKPKTRGVPTAEVNGNSDLADRKKDEVPAISATPVSTRAYKVFATLFNAGKDGEMAVQNGSVAWKDIQTAFAQLDFGLQKTRGSAWTFRHPDGHRSVTIHEPHPEPTMDFFDARRFGRRLTRRFGWTLGNFVCDPKMS